MGGKIREGDWDGEMPIGERGVDDIEGGSMLTTGDTFIVAL